MLVVLGVISSTLSFVVDSASEAVGNMQGNLATTVSTNAGAATHPAAMLVWVLCGAAGSALAYLITSKTPAAQGSGIPEMKCELRELHLQGFLTRRVVAAKACGLAVARGAGLPIGKEGPFVHCSACVSEGLLRSCSEWLGTSANQGRLRKAFLTASVAVGVGATFTVPIAGVLFALEVMPDTAWHNTTYWSCLIASISGSITLRLLRSFAAGSFAGNMVPPVVATDLGTPGLSIRDDPGSTRWFIVSVIILGAICGLLGGAFTLCQQAVQKRLTRWRLAGAAPPRMPWSWRHQKKDHGTRTATTEALTGEASPELVYLQAGKASPQTMNPQTPVPPSVAFWRNLMLCIAVAALNSALTYLIPPLRSCSQRKLLGRLFSHGNVDFSQPLVSKTPPIDAWLEVPQLMALLIALAVKVLTSVLALSLPVPCGCISPVYVLGALLGRTYGILIEAVLGEAENSKFLPARFALVGAAAFGAAVCRSFSLAVAIFELMPLAAIVLPLATASIVSILVANLVAPSYFDAILRAKQLPGSLQFRSLEQGLHPVKDFAKPVFAQLNRFCTLDEIQTTLGNHVQAEQCAVVDDRGVLISIVTIRHLETVEQQLSAHPDLAGSKQDILKGIAGVPAPTNIQPLQVTPHATLQDLAVAFVMHRCEVAYVTDHGLPLGIVSSSDLAEIQE